MLCNYGKIPSPDGWYWAANGQSTYRKLKHYNIGFNYEPNPNATWCGCVYDAWVWGEEPVVWLYQRPHGLKTLER